MDLTKREIFRKVDNNELTAFLDADYMNIVYKAMEDYAAQEAIAFADWLCTLKPIRLNKSTKLLWADFRAEVAIEDEKI